VATFSVGGLVSGIDYNTLIDKILELERRPAAQLEQRQAAYRARIEAYDTLASKLDALRAAADDVRTTSAFYVKTARVSDATLLEAAASASAAEGTYSVTVDRLAQAHRIASSGVGSETAVVGTGSGSFAFSVGGGAPTTVAVTAETTLAGLRDAINAAGGDATASLVFDGASWRLVLTAVHSGAANAIVITENATTLGFPTGPVAGGSTLRAAQDAAFSIDGLSMTREDNVVEDALPGVTLTLEGTGSGTVSVTRDTAAIRARIEALVAAYNDVVSFVASKAYYDPATGQGGPLAGEGTARDVVTRLRTLAAARVAGLPEELRVLAQVGITTGRDGTLSVDGSVLGARLAADLDGVAALFASEGGVAGAFYDYADQAADSVTGAVALRKKGLERIVSGLAAGIERIEERLAKEEEALRTRFAALEALVAGLSSQGAFLSGLLSGR